MEALNYKGRFAGGLLRALYKVLYGCTKGPQSNLSFRPAMTSSIVLVFRRVP